MPEQVWNYGRLLPKLAATEALGLPVVDVPSEELRRGQEWFGGSGGGLFGPLDLKYIEMS